MSAFGGLLLTNRGRNLQSKAQTGIQLQYTRIALGDGALGSTPIADLNALNNQKKSLSVSKLRILSGGRAVIGSTLSNQDMNEGFYFREIGVFAQDPDIGEILYCYANAGTLAEYIPPAGGADVIEKSIDVQTLVGNAQNISAVIDNSLVFASEADLTFLRDQIEGDIGDLLLLETDEKGSIVAAVNEIEQKRKTHSADYLKHTGYAVATGSTNAYVATLNPALSAYAEGVSLRLKINVANTGASTVNVNGLGAKPILKSNGSAVASGNLKSGSVYTLAYDGTSFILQGEGASGNATASDLLSGKTATTDAGDITGNIPNYSRASLGQGYAGVTSARGDGGGSLVVEPLRGYYEPGLNANGFGSIILADANYKPDSILQGKSIFGVAGTVAPGKRLATGSITLNLAAWGSTATATTIVHNLGVIPNFIGGYIDARDMGIIGGGATINYFPVVSIGAGAQINTQINGNSTVTYGMIYSWSKTPTEFQVHFGVGLPTSKAYTFHWFAVE